MLVCSEAQRKLKRKKTRNSSAVYSFFLEGRQLREDENLRSLGRPIVDRQNCDTRDVAWSFSIIPHG
jgi:hypothetical protein